MVPEKLIVCTF